MSTARDAQFIDVQPLLQRVCDGMAVGELLAAENFSLQDSMQAIEIGDPKMDIGLRREEVGTAEELIAAGQAPADLPPPQLLALLDQLLAMEATWHTGTMLPLSVFTSLYMLDVDRLKANVVLHAFCVALRSTCTAVTDIVVSGQACEDEDISVHTFGVRLDPPGVEPVHDAQRTVRDAVAWLEANSAVENSAALVSRLRLRVALLDIFERLQRPSVASVTEVLALCAVAAAHLDAVQSSALPQEALAAAPGFVPGVNRRHMGLVPPRPVNVASLPAAADHWRATLDGIAAACRLLLGVSTWPALRAGLVEFAARPNQPIVRSVMHHVLVKPLHIAAAAVPKAPDAAASEEAAAPAPEAADNAQPAAALPPWCPSEAMIAAEFGLTPAAVPPGDPALFFEQCAIAVQGWCHTMCLNRCRQRRRLRRLLEDWRNMTDHAFNAEAAAELQAALAAAGSRWVPKDPEGRMLAGPLSAWVEHEAAGTMVGHLLLGGPLELYAGHELCSVYWYCDYLLTSAHQAMADLQSMRPAPPAPPAVKSSTKGKGKAAGKVAPKSPPAHNASFSAAALVSQVNRLMCQGVVKLATGLMQLRLIKPPSGHFSTERERFHQRFACFAQLLRPEPLRFEDLDSALAAGAAQPQQYLLLAFDSFVKADNGAAAALQGGAVEHLAPAEVKHLTGVRRVAAQNMMALKLLITALASAAAGGGGPGVAAFRASWDYRVARQHSALVFFPCLMLKSAAKAK